MRSPLLLASLTLMISPALAQMAPIQITADLTDAPRKLYHAEIDIPVRPGPLTLLSPQWIPAAHVPVGPIANIVGLVFTANGKTLEWKRDDVNLFAYHLTIPQGATSVHVHVDNLATTRQSPATSVSAVLEWESLMIYPAGIPVKSIAIQPSVTVPAGWGIGTSLKPISAYDPAHPAGGTVHYATTNVEMLEDAPIVAGLYFHEYDLAPDVTPKHFLDVIGGRPESIVLSPEALAQFGRLVHEGIAMYGAPHYTSYHFLLGLPDKGVGGIEHHESSNSAMPANALKSEEAEIAWADIVPHEFTHSWNGKYRQPGGLTTTDFATPMKGELLWVYEGMTQYMGYVLAARSGFLSQQHFRESLAFTAAQMEATRGRAWRSTEDTATGDGTFRGGGSGWSNWRRSIDFYWEGVLLWLDVDTTIRRLTRDKKNLHDFDAIFFQKEHSGQPLTMPYEFDELVTDLNQVVPYDWAAFLHDRVSRINPHANLEGIEQGGYKMVYADTPSEYQAADMKAMGTGPDMFYSLGLSVESDGSITDVRWGGPCDKAKLAPSEKITRVNDKPFSIEALHEAIRTSKSSTVPIRLVVQNDLLVLPIEVDYHDGERYPTLVRVEGTPDYLDEIASPLTTSR